MTSVEEFESFTDIEHVRKRPDMWIGSVKPLKEERWIIEGLSAVLSEVNYNPGLEQCILELITNATDHAARCKAQNLNLVTTIKVNISEDYKSISIYNDGKGIPIEKHSKTGLYVPEMIFGSLRTSSNYDDTKKKTWGGKNGIGAKAANILSNEFIIEVQTNDKNYIQKFSKGMMERTEPVIKNKKGKDYVKITYLPDFKYFGLEDFKSDDTIHLIEKRCYDSSAVTDSKVSLWYNNNKIPIKDFSDYMKLYIGQSKKVIYSTDRWEVGFAVCPYDNSTQISFVNGICTEEGGSHVEHVLDPVLTSITKALQEKHKGIDIKKSYIKDNVIIFIKSLIDNPVFDSQLKRKLKSKISDFGTRCDVPEDIIKKIAKLGITDNVVEMAKVKDMKKALNKIDSGKKRIKLSHIKNLYDANKAGTKENMKCTLILTEGNSAMQLALNGIPSAGGQDYWGVFPLRGKFLNIRTATASQLEKNEEMSNINQIMGLYEGLTDITKLRYGKIMTFSDQDHDGYHIKGLLMNYFSYRWPELVEKGLIVTMITPVLKVFKGKNFISDFYNLNDYKNWLKNNDDSYRTKYYKGLGTSTKEEAKEYFKNLDKNMISYLYNDKKHSKKLEMVFDKSKSNERKDWIKQALEDPKEMDYNEKKININDFIDKELVTFSIYDNQRSIPNLIDGLKPSNRKILYTCLKHNFYLKNDGKGEIKVITLTGKVMEDAAYHHGDASLQSTITSMAQEFVGSGNFNLLYPSGQFGSRNQGGKDAASARYISTYLKDYVKILFNDSDNELLEYEEDDGKQIEPKYYVPIIPLILLNGSVGIGTGWSTDIPCFNPKDVIDNIKLLLKDEEIKEMTPWYRYFKGTITKIEGKYAWESKGIFNRLSNKIIEVNEIPVGMWKEDFMNNLKELELSGIIDTFTMHSKKDGDDINYKIYFNEDITDSEINKILKLEKTIQGSNMVAFDENCVIQKYGSAEDILWDFYKCRLKFYVKRREYLIKKIEKKIEKIGEKVRYVNMIVNDELIVFKKKKEVLKNELIELKFINIKDLLDMTVYHFTEEEIDKLNNDLNKLKEEYESLKNKSHKDIWYEDLEKLESFI